MKTTLTEGKSAPASNVRDLKCERQRRAARRMAMQTILLQFTYPYLFRLVRSDTLS